MDIKTAIVFLVIGLGEGYILTDWWHNKQLIKAQARKR